MSTTYVPEPATTGKVILVTTHGELDIQLWSRETPLACRNFIQLCLEGYYDKTIFHRLIPGFMIQGGDPTGTGTGGQSIYGQAFKDQFHQRLKFGHRGLVAMANTGRSTNKSQFFITFGEAVHLNKKHTIFGRVVGNTMFNLLSMQAEETDSEDRPLIPPKILKTKVIINPFDDIKPRNSSNQQQERGKVQREKESKAKQQKQVTKAQNKQLKKKSLLSFEDEENETQTKIPSSHDALDDKSLLKKVVITHEQLEWKRKMRQLDHQKKQDLKKAVTEQNPELEVADISTELRDQIKKRLVHQGETQVRVEDDITKFQTRVNPQTGKRQIYWKEDLPQVDAQNNSESEEIDDVQLKQIRDLQKQQYDAIKANELRFKEVQEGSLNPAEKLLRMQEKFLLSNVQKRRMEFLEKRDMEQHQGNMLDKLDDFRKRLKSKNQAALPEWASHRLKFHVDSDNAFRLTEAQNNDGDDGGLMVIDSVPEEYKMKRKGIDIQELYRLSKQE